MSSPFREDLFRSTLTTSWLGSEFVSLKCVDSTNSWLKQLPADQFVHGMVVQTDEQTAGRGQYKRPWQAVPSGDLMFTMGFQPPSADRLPLLTVACASAVISVFEEVKPLPFTIKWPNDILAGGKKMGGILTECLFFGKKPDRVLVGIGLNLAKRTFDGELENSATSLGNLTESEIDREDILSRCLGHIERAYLRWHKQDPELHKQLNKKLQGYGEWVELAVDGKTAPGTYKFLGINQNGECIALNENLDIKIYSHEQLRIIPRQH